jgi:hypothetical protein
MYIQHKLSHTYTCTRLHVSAKHVYWYKLMYYFICICRCMWMTADMMHGIKIGKRLCGISVYWNNRDALFVQFIENQRPLHVSSIICSSSGGAKQTAFGILHACNVGWQTAIVLQPTDITRTQYTKCRLCSASWGWASNAWNMLLNKLNKRYITLVSLYWCTMMYGQQNIKRTGSCEFNANWIADDARMKTKQIGLC